MWPAVAVEGSDSFDAISRSYSYVFSRPWRAAFYGAVALVYGAICYVFVRFFVLLALKSARFFAGLGVAYLARPGTGSAAATKIDTLWPEPTWGDLVPAGPPFGAKHWEGFGAILCSLWLMLVIALVWSFVCTFYFSASTVIYYLLRQRVDGTDFEDVYTEEDEELETGGTAEPSPAASAEAEGEASQAQEAGKASEPPAAPEPPAEPKKEPPDEPGPSSSGDASGAEGGSEGAAD